MVLKTLRGGSWYDFARICRSAFRRRSAPGFRIDSLGFRVLRPALKLKNRVLRGGSWLLSRHYVHIAKRLYRRLARRNNYGGFRVVR